MFFVHSNLYMADEDKPIHDPYAEFASTLLKPGSGSSISDYDKFISAFNAIENDLEQVIYFEDMIENQVVRARLVDVLSEYHGGELPREASFRQLLNTVEKKRIASLEKYFIIQHNEGPILAVIKASDKKQAGTYFHAEINGINVPMLNRGMVTSKCVEENFAIDLINSGVTSNA